MAGYSQRTLSQKLGVTEGQLIYFVNRKSDLEKKFPVLKKMLGHDASLWICWPKGSSGKPTDLDGNIVREIGLRNGLVDVKVIAVDDVWSGLKFVYRLKDRI